MEQESELSSVGEDGGNLGQGKEEKDQQEAPPKEKGKSLSLDELNDLCNTVWTNKETVLAKLPPRNCTTVAAVSEKAWASSTRERNQGGGSQRR